MYHTIIIKILSWSIVKSSKSHVVLRSLRGDQVHLSRVSFLMHVFKSMSRMKERRSCSKTPLRLLLSYSWHEVTWKCSLPWPNRQHTEDKPRFIHESFMNNLFLSDLLIYLLDSFIRLTSLSFSNSQNWFPKLFSVVLPDILKPLLWFVWNQYTGK